MSNCQLEDSLDCFDHALLLDAVQEVGDHVGEARNLVEVLLALFPDDVGSAEHTFCHLAGVAGCPEFLQQVHDLLCVVGLDRSAVGTLAALVVGDDGSETENQALRQFAFALQVGLQTRQVARLKFRELIEHDARHLMVDEGVVEALEHVAGKLLQLVQRQVEGLHELVELYLVDVL